MSFSVDLWNGFEIIKNHTKLLSNKLRGFYRLINSLKLLEIDYLNKLDLTIREYKDNNNSDYLIDDSFKKLVETLEYSHKIRTNYLNNINQLSNEQNYNSFLEQAKSKMTACINEYVENTSNFDRLLKVVIDKQISFHKNCKDLSLNLAQLALDEIHKKTTKVNIDKILDKVKQSKEEYTDSINDCNKEREIYNYKSEILLENLENNYKSILEKFKKDIIEFSGYRLELFKKLSVRETNTYEKIYSKLEPSKDITNLILNNATKEFPMIKIELCPVKTSALVGFVKQKIKIKDEEIDGITKSIVDYFSKNIIFKDELFFNKIKKVNNKTFSFFNKKEENSNSDTTMKNFKILEKNKKYLENFTDSLFFDNKMTQDDDNNNNTEKNQVEDIIMKSPECIQLLKNPENYLIYIETLLKRLTNIRSKGTLELKKEGYGVILGILDMIVQDNPKNYYIIKNVMILCQTFYKMENNKKIYLVDGIRNRGIFNTTETWHRAINYSLNFSTRDKDLTNNKKNEIKERINKEAVAVVLAYLWDILQFTNDETVFNNVKDYYVQLYNIDENIVEQQIKQYKIMINKNKEDLGSNIVKEINEEKEKEQNIEEENNKIEIDINESENKEEIGNEGTMEDNEENNSNKDDKTNPENNEIENKIEDIEDKNKNRENEPDLTLNDGEKNKIEEKKIDNDNKIDNIQKDTSNANKYIPKNKPNNNIIQNITKQDFLNLISKFEPKK